MKRRFAAQAASWVEPQPVDWRFVHADDRRLELFCGDVRRSGYIDTDAAFLELHEFLDTVLGLLPGAVVGISVEFNLLRPVTT